ncbi:MAG: sodium-dependent bicarbonate transport family permease [Pseudotabrizicola sp.]|uniref:sodium-dependent bicarbonate transport family permease n=1 Tax=Pseudotabrizicola sp. TaxID=2939647 RepID=UPI002731747F|nr:sodium-dependent bicarbonate transport family permease [Pseudotabrizicola sp.]MDP2081882.1 sodium-dependent bicarbonate transport family permease [Pseudotabrizicola sp.]MDZ7573827.1 sodium-dependent bicarbonate transport family permease [Pseudotabrizicola sp.]
MHDILSLAADNLLSPMILCFALGLFAALARSELTVPEAAAKALSIYLLFAIGFKGGVAVADHGVDGRLISALLAGVVLSFALPFVAFGLLRGMTRLSITDAAAVAAHYGSISIVTFVTAASVLTSQGIASEGYMVAVAAAMEAPAIISALWLVSRAGSGAQRMDADLWREILLNGSIVLLVGSFVIGIVTGQDGMVRIESFIVSPFQGVLCLFLLDMGLVAGRGLRTSRGVLTLGAVAFGFVMPVVGALIGLAAGLLLGLSTGGVALMMVLAASASYIAVPAAMRVALPEANPSVYLTLSLGVTFPFNLTLGIPAYVAIAQAVTGG